MELHQHQVKDQKSIVKETYNFVPVIDLLKSMNNQDHLVVFDVDDVLITPSGDDDLRHPYRHKLLQSILNRINQQQIELLKSNLFLNTRKFLVESSITDIFAHLTLYKIPAMALTAVNKRFLDANCKGRPMLKSGIIFKSGLDKGLVLEYIFKKYNYYPKTVIFVDDLIENVESLQQTCFKLNIDFYGFHYKAASLIPLSNIDEDLEKLRFEILEKEFIWLSHKKLKTKKYFSRLIN